MRGYLAMTRAEFRLFRREPFSVVFVFAFPLMMMMLLSAVFGNDQADAQDMENGMLVWRAVPPTNHYTAASMFRPLAWASLTQTSVAPAEKAPSQAAATCSVMRSLNWPQLEWSRLVSSQWAMPAMPSISALM